jgi:hypothetical protein
MAEASEICAACYQNGEHVRPESAADEYLREYAKRDLDALGRPLARPLAGDQDKDAA